MIWPSRSWERHDVVIDPGIVVQIKGIFTPPGSYIANSKSNTNIAIYRIEDEVADTKQINRTNVFEDVFSNIEVIFNDTSSVYVGNHSDGKSGRGSTLPSYNLPRLSAEIQIAFYSIIFLLALVGNLLIIVTLVQNKRMRTVTNVFLLNLAISDLLLALVCMPFTLVPVLLMDFIFGKFMCVFIRYLQAVSVGVSCFTLVAISLERYFAICRPLHSRSWQTLSHAYRCIAVCWFLAAVIMTPTAVFQKHIAIGNGAHRCREIWPDQRVEQAYTVLLDLALLILPVSIMSVAYGRVVHVLIFDVRSSLELEVTRNGKECVKNRRTVELRILSRDSCRSVTSLASTDTSFSDVLSTQKGSSRAGRKSRRSARNRIRRSNPTSIRQNKMRVIRMLFVVVVEFFVCWTPVYLLQTWMVFHEESAYQVITPLNKTLFHLLSYVSSCCNPITYCFMNRKFREAFLRVFQCWSPVHNFRGRRTQRLQEEFSLQSTGLRRRGTTIIHLNEPFTSSVSTTSRSVHWNSASLKHPEAGRCNRTGQSAEEFDVGNLSD